MDVGWAYDRFLLKHDTGPTHPERPERLEAIVDALSSAGLLQGMRSLPCAMASIETLQLAHEPAYVDLVRLACEEGMTFLGTPETRICPESHDAARLAAGAVAAACDAVMEGQVNGAFCAVRPPGHHAERDRAMGFCLFNHVAIAAEHLIGRWGLQRVAIVDWDVHHGNGTQQIFEERADVMYVSLHEAPEFLFPHTGYEHERGRGAGRGFTLNVPLKPGSGDVEYRQAFAESVIPRLDSFDPQFILISAGFDAARDERTADMNLEPASFEWMTEQVLQAASRHCGGRVVSVLEGGYDAGSLGRCVTAHVQALMRA